MRLLALLLLLASPVRAQVGICVDGVDVYTDGAWQGCARSVDAPASCTGGRCTLDVLPPGDLDACSKLATAVGDTTGSCGDVVLSQSPTILTPLLDGSTGRTRIISGTNAAGSPRRGITIEVPATITWDHQTVSLFDGTTTVGAGGTLRGIGSMHADTVVFTANPSAVGAVEIFTDDTHFEAGASTISTGLFTSYGEARHFHAPTGTTFTINDVFGPMAVNVLNAAPHFTAAGTGTGHADSYAGVVFMVPGLAEIETGWDIDVIHGWYQRPIGDEGGTVDSEGFADIDLSDSIAADQFGFRIAGPDAASYHEGMVAIGKDSNPTTQLDIVSTATTDGIISNFSGTLTTDEAHIRIGTAGTTFGAGASIQGVAHTGASTLGANPGAFGFGNFFADSPAIANADSTAVTVAGYNSFLANPVWNADDAALSLTNGILVPVSYGGFVFSPTFTRQGTPTQTAASVTGFFISGGALADVGAGWTVTAYRGLHYQQPGGSGTLTTQVAVDIDALTQATTNIGIRNASTTVTTPSAAQTISAAGNTVACNATSVRVSNGTGGSITLTSAPTIANGQPGQRCAIMSVGSQNVVLQDQGTLGSSNLRLGANTRTLSPRSSIELEYDATVGDWIERGFVTVL